jgi:predicted transcriptional regulator
VIREGGNRPDVIVSILKAANFGRGVTLAKITEKVNLIESTYSLKQYLSVLEKKD